MPAPRTRLHDEGHAWLLWILPALLVAWWWSEVSDIPWSLIDHGEYFWRTRELRAALARGDVGDASSLLCELRHPFDAPLGRLRPFEWVWVAVVTSVGEVFPPAFNGAAPVVFALGVVLAGAIARRITGSWVCGLLAQVLLGLPWTSSAMWLRVGCHEPPMILLGGGALSLALSAREGTRHAGIRDACAAALMVMCVGTKEITVHLAPALLLLWALFGRDSSAPDRARCVRRVAWAGLGAITLLIVAYPLVVGSSRAGSYSSGYEIGLDVFVSRAALLGGWLWGDFLVLVPLVAASCAVRLVRARRSGLGFADRLSLVLLTECAAYLAVYLPWKSLPERVVPGFTFSFAILAALEVRGWAVASRSAVSPLARGAARLALAATLAVVCRGMVDGPSAGHLSAQRQRTRYAADAAMVAELAHSLPRDGTVLFDVPIAAKELAVGTALHLRFWHGRPDVRVRMKGVDPLPPRADLVVAFADAESDAGRSLRAPGAEPRRIRRAGCVEFWTVRNVARSAWFALRHGRWPGVPTATPSYEWKIWPGRPETDPPR